MSEQTREYELKGADHARPINYISTNVQPDSF